MKIKVVSIPVLDQEKALTFYTEILDFVIKQDIPLGDGNRWLTLVSKEDLKGPEILLEPSPKHFEPSKVYQEKLYQAKIPYTQLYVVDINAIYEKLKTKNVNFITTPTNAGSVYLAVFDDTCGNLIQLIQPKG
ncbi:UNVERIFIED_CONTAM: hypothetical protein GTU68_045910 [Idotea baltica]|nr:hypothetical protein [Idotea baltica]